MNLPKEDLPIYQILFETEYSLEIVKGNLSTIIREFKRSIEELQKCEFKVLDNISVEHLLEWLKFNFIYLQKETDGLNKYYNRKEQEIFDEYLKHHFTEYNSFEDFKETFKVKKKEYEHHKEIRRLKEHIKSSCKKHLYAIEVKTNKHIPEILERLSFPKEYNKFKKSLPNMIEYKKETGKKVFFRGNLSKQFLKWYNS